MKNLVRRAAGLAALLALAGCVDRPTLFEPGVREEARAIRLPVGELAVYEEDTVRLPVEGTAPGSRVQLLILDDARAVLWRSEIASVEGHMAAVPVSVPGGFGRGTPHTVTAVLLDAHGGRLYASDDTVAVTRLADAATRTVRVFAGRRVAAGASSLSSLALAPELERAFFPVPEDGAVGMLDLSGDGVVGARVSAGIRPERVAYRAGVLAVLGAGGSSVSFLRARQAGLSPWSQTPLTAFELEFDTLITGAVRPVGTGLALGCGGTDCASVHAFIPSGLQVLRGTLSRPGAGGVLRVVDAAAEGRHPGLVLPEFAEVVDGDTALAAAVFAPLQSGREVVQRRENASVCLSASGAAQLLAAGPGGVVYALDLGRDPACGPGTQIIRIEGAAGPDPRVSSLAIRNTRAEERISGATDIALSDDGAGLLLLRDGEVMVLDSVLRVRGGVPVPGARAVAWLRGGGEPRFAVADAAGVTVYDASRLTATARIPIGPTTGPLVYLHRASGADVIAAVIPGGFVVSPVPAQP